MGLAATANTFSRNEDPAMHSASGQEHVIYLATIRVIPVIIAITFHEAAHGFIAHLLGDDTAWWLGRGRPLWKLAAGSYRLADHLPA